jgi:uncharacterized membrane protein YphA (DoxX/SURF4 family)
MFSLFPALFTFDQYSQLLIRLTLAAIFFVWSWTAFRKAGATATEKTVAVLEAIAGILLIVGYATQGAAAFAVIDLIIRIAGKVKSRQFLTAGINYYLIVLVLAISLLITFPGAFSLDYPL